MQNASNGPEGLFIDLIEYFALSLDWQVEYVDKPWSELLVDLEEGEIDLLPAVAVTDERLGIYDYSRDPPFVDSGVLFIGTSFHLDTIFDLQGARVAGVEGSIFTDGFVSYAASFGVECDILLTEDNPSVMQAITDGTADAGICIYSLGTELARKYPVKMTAVTFFPRALSFAVPKGKNSDLIAGIDRVLAPMLKDPDSEYGRSFEKWITAGPSASIPVWIWWGIGGLCLVGIVFGAWTITLKKRVSARTRHLAAEISERTRAEEELATSQSELHEVHRLAQLGVWSWEPAADVVTWNEELFRISGRDQRHGAPSFKEQADLYTPESWERLQAAVEEALASGKPYNLDLEMLRPDGERRWTNAWGGAERGPTGEVVRLHGTVQDMTERKQADAALRESEEKYRSLIERANDGIVIIQDGLISLANPGAARIWGGDIADLVGSAFADHIDRAEVSTVVDRYRRRMAGEKVPPIYETVIRAVDGHKIFAELSAETITYEGRPADYVIIRDLSERKAAEAAIRERDEQLRQSQKMEAVGQLAGGIAHDFNNLLTAIIGYSDLLLASEQMSDSPDRKDLEEIKHAAERAGSLTRQILAFSRRQALKPDVVSLNEVLTGLEPLLHRTLGERIDLVSLKHPDLGHTEIDIHQFEQVLVNLALNARDAMPSGGRLTLETANVEFDEEYCRNHPDAVPGACVMLAVSDDGTGMDEATRERVFEPFFTTKAPGAGTGLGLAMVHGVVKQSGGNIFVYSEPGKGTTFKIYLPRVESGPAVQKEEITVSGQVSGGETIMVVEDESSLRGLVARVLGEAGYEVMTYGSADAAAKALDGGEIVPDLLLTDVVLPGALQGKDFVDHALSVRPDLPVLYMSGYTRNAIVHAGRLDEGVNFLEKPFTAGALVRKVREVLDRVHPSG